MQDGAPLTAAAFGPDGVLIALATAGNRVALFETATLRHTPWSLAHAPGRALARLARMPGSIAGISFCPDPRVRVSSAFQGPSEEI